jgi:CHAT domain-containing protein
VVEKPQPPRELELPELSGASPGADAVLSGAMATPARVLAELGNATDVEIHAHGLRAGADADTSFLALTPDVDGHYELAAADIAKTRLARRPLVVLAACETTEAAPYLHETWDLPAAFLVAGARAVIASDAQIPDAEAARFFDGIRARTSQGVAVAQATRDERIAWLAKPGSEWVKHVIVFEAFVAGNHLKGE